MLVSFAAQSSRALQALGIRVPYAGFAPALRAELENAAQGVTLPRTVSQRVLELTTPSRQPSPQSDDTSVEAGSANQKDSAELARLREEVTRARAGERQAQAEARAMRERVRVLQQQLEQRDADRFALRLGSQSTVVVPDVSWQQRTERELVGGSFRTSPDRSVIKLHTLLELACGATAEGAHRTLRHLVVEGVLRLAELPTVRTIRTMRRELQVLARICGASRIGSRDAALLTDGTTQYGVYKQAFVVSIKNDAGGHSAVAIGTGTQLGKDAETSGRTFGNQMRLLDGVLQTLVDVRVDDEYAEEFAKLQVRLREK